MTVFGSTCTRILIDRTLICHAILYHFQITLTCGHINRPIIPLTLFLLSRPLEQLEFIRFSNLQAEIWFVLSLFPDNPSYPTENAPTQLPKSISTTSLHSKTSSFKSPARDDLLINFLVSRIHSVQEFHISRIQSRKNVFETNIVVIHNQIPHISLPDPPFLRSRRHSRHRSFSLSLARAVRWYIFDESFTYESFRIIACDCRKKRRLRAKQKE